MSALVITFNAAVALCAAVLALLILGAALAGALL